MLALDNISGAEKLKLVRELGTIRTHLPQVANGANKLSLIKRIREIRDLLSIAISDSKPVTLTINPENKEASYRSLTDYLENGINRMPEALKYAEVAAILSIDLLLNRLPGNNDSSLADSQKYARLIDGFKIVPDEEKLDLFEHFKASGPTFQVDIELVKSVQAEIDKLKSEPLDDLPEIASEKSKIMDQIEKLSSEWKETQDKNGGFTSSLVDEYEKLNKTYKELQEKLKDLNSVKYVEREKKIEELRVQLTDPGKKIINTLLDASPVTQQQAEEWAGRQKIDKSVLTRLKKTTGYTEKSVRRDMAEFYRITGGKLRNIDIVTSSGKRANAGNIGHVEFNEVRIDSRLDKETLWHEMAHHLEADPVARLAANGFLIKRRESDRVYSLRHLTGNKGFGRNEVAYKDEFINHYIGKVYRDGVTEVFSMGIQYLSDPEKAAAFLAKDLEMASFITGYLQSDLTPAMKALQALQDHAAGLNQDKRSKIENEYQDAINKLAAGVEIVDDGWFGSLSDAEKNELLGSWYLKDENAKFLGSWDTYRVFSGKFKNFKTNRVAKGYAVVYTKPPLDEGDRWGITVQPFHGELQDVKAFLRLSFYQENNIRKTAYSLFYSHSSKESVIAVAKALSGVQA